MDTVRRLEGEFAQASSVRQQLARAELDHLGTRMELANQAITACTANALCVCLVVAIMLIGWLAEISFGRLIAGLFVLTMALLVTGLEADGRPSHLAGLH